MNIYKTLAGIIGIIIMISATFLAYLEFNSLDRAGETIVHKTKDQHSLLPLKDTINLLSWNIGYGGLGQEMDFFYEGGKLVRPDKSQYDGYFEGILSLIGSRNVMNFILLQEVDVDSKRSYFYNQFDKFNDLLIAHSGFFCANYQSAFIPIPLHQPLGKVKSGLALFSEFHPSEVTRIASPASYFWPKRLFFPNRCFQVAAFSAGEKKLILINLHNSAYADAADMRSEELDLLRTLLLDEYHQGNYVIAGGDWNMHPPGYPDPSGSIASIPKSYMPKDWQWVYESRAKTNRSVEKPFSEEQSQTWLIDYFLTSPNVEVLNSKTIDLNFKNSDHNPVWITVRLKK